MNIEYQSNASASDCNRFKSYACVCVLQRQLFGNKLFSKMLKADGNETHFENKIHLTTEMKTRPKTQKKNATATFNWNIIQFHL